MTGCDSNTSYTAHGVYFQHIDVFKGLVILLVVVGHLIQGTLEGGGRQHPLYMWIYLFHMPAFFFCSGFLNKWIENTKSSYYKYFKGKITRILIPYLVWCVIMYIYSNRPLSLMDFIAYVTLHPSYGLWFLYSLFKCFATTLVFIALINNILTGGVKHIRLSSSS